MNIIIMIMIMKNDMKWKWLMIIKWLIMKMIINGINGNSNEIK